jgi:hypothetical protein
MLISRVCCCSAAVRFDSCTETTAKMSRQPGSQTKLTARYLMVSAAIPNVLHAMHEARELMLGMLSLLTAAAAVYLQGKQSSASEAP